MYLHLFYKLIFLCLPFFSISFILLSLFLASTINAFSVIQYLIVNFWALGFKTSKASTCFFTCSAITFICFSNALLRGKYTNLACSIIYLWLQSNISSPVRYSFLSIFPDDNADIFVASLLISYCNFSSLILSWIVMISFYILSKRFVLKPKELSDARVALITKKEYGFAVYFL